jgi:hypothetical protein
VICREPTSVHSGWLLFFAGLLLEGIFAERAFGKDGPYLVGLVGVAVTILELGYATDGTSLPWSFLAWI